MSRPYKLTDFDTLQGIATRFSAEIEVLQRGNAALRGVDVNAKFPMSLVGLVIQLPDDESGMPFDWQPYASPGGEKLAAICKKALKNRRFVGDPGWWMTPESIYDAYENADFRAGHGQDAGAVTTGPGEVVMIPYPNRRAGAQWIPVTPNGATTVTLPPPWVTELMNSYEWIRGQARRFVVQLADLRKQQNKAVQEVGILNSLAGVLELAIAFPSRDPFLCGKELATMRALRTKLNDATETAIHEMYDKYFENVGSPALDAMKALGHAILERMHDAHFVDLVKQLAASAVRYPRAYRELGDVLAFAYTALADSPLVDEVQADVDAVGSYLAGLRPVDTSRMAPGDEAFVRAVKTMPAGVKPNSALGSMFGAVAVVGGGAGNLPGPSTLTVGVIRLLALYEGRKALNAVQPSPLLPALSEAAAARVFAATMNGLDWATAVEREEIAQFVADVRRGVLNRIKYSKILEQAQVPPILRQADDLLVDTAMASRNMGIGFSLVNALLFGLAIADTYEHGLTASTAGELAGGTVGMVQVGGLVGASLGLMEKAAVTGLGKVCAGVAVAVGIFETGVLLYNRKWAEAGVSAVSTLGAAFLCASLFFPPAAPLLAVIGGVLVIGATVYGLITGDTSWEDVQDLFRPDPEVWWLHTLASFTSGDNYKTISAKSSSLGSAMSSLRTAITNTEFVLIEWARRKDAVKLVGDQTVGMLAEPPPDALTR